MWKTIVLIFVFIFAMPAQECRITAISPAQPPLKVEEGERALESQTFQTAVFALSPDRTPYFFDTASRIRRIDASGRMVTVAGNGERALDALTPGPARETPLPAIGQMLFSPDGVLHFTGTGRVYRVVNGRIEVVAGTGRPGFNGESGPATELNLGGIVNIAYSQTGALLILDGHNRLRRLEADGTLQTIAGSTRIAATAGLTGDNGPATQAALSSPRQVVPLRDGSLWIKDLSGRHIRLITPDGMIRTVNTNFEPTVNILMLPDGTPAAATDNRVYPIRPNGNIETGANPFFPFTGTPRAIAPDGTLYFQGSTRPDQRNPLLRMDGRGAQTVIGGAPVPPTVDGQAAPFGVWLARTGSLIYAASLGGKSGLLEVRPGQQPKFIAGGGSDFGDADGKAATDLAIFGIAAFTVDSQGRIIIADVNRIRILIVGTDGKVTVLKDQAGQPIPYSAMGSLSGLQKIAADKDGNIYWFSQGATPTGGVFTAVVSVWNRATQSVTTTPQIVGLNAIVRREDGSTALIAGNATNFRSLYSLTPEGQGGIQSGLKWLPLAMVAQWRDKAYFIAASRLFRGEPGSIEWFDLATLPSGATFTPDFVVAGPDSIYVHLTDGGFYRVENVDACKWTAQPKVNLGGVVNAASYEYPNTVSPRQLITVFGTGLGPAEGQGMILDAALRAGAQQAPYPALVLGNFSGTIPQSAVSGTSLPVIYSNATQATVQAPSSNPASGEYLLYFSWQGLTLIHPETIKAVASAPGLFTTGGVNGHAAALNQDGTVNSSSNPARAGSVVQLFGTGFGASNPNLGTGLFWSVGTLVPTTAAVQALVGGGQATVTFAGGAPGQIGGVYQINVKLGEDLTPGEHEIEITVAGQTASQRARISVQ